MSAEATESPVAVLRAIAAEYLPHDDAGRAEVRISVAFLSRAAVEPALATHIAAAFAGFCHSLHDLFQSTGLSCDPAAEARRLAALLDGLRLPVLVGALSDQDALVVVNRHLTLVETDDQNQEPTDP